MTQTNLFDLPKALELRDKGITRAADANASLVHEARQIAIDHCKRFGEVTADDVAREMRKRGYGSIGNSAGAIFRDRRFVFAGKFITSQRAIGHGNLLRVWRLR